MADNNQRALVLFSGGQDSATCLAWALDRFAHVETIGFDYGQRHRIELACRKNVLHAFGKDFPAWRGKLGEDHVVSLPFFRDLGHTAMTSDMEIVFEENGLPNTFVPGRNIFFLTTAAVIAYRRSLKHIIGGMCETDYSGYPDCRDDTIKALQTALNLGLDTRLVLHTPLMWIGKADTWAMAERLGGPALVELIREETHTCYLGDRGQKHPWGYGCGSCPACELRAKGYGAFVARAGQ